MITLWKGPKICLFAYDLKLMFSICVITSRFPVSSPEYAGGGGGGGMYIEPNPNCHTIYIY